jgi:signal transduction histidine kinase
MPDLVLVDIDPDKLDRALTNVLENAAKFTPPGGRIDVRGRPGLEGGVSCAVSNSGSAIPDEELPRIFDRFYRGDRARRSTGGSGLGLAITRELIELQGGVIEVWNQADGVTFEMTLPGFAASPATRAL